MRTTSMLERIGLGLVLSLLAGIALAGLAFPVLGGVGLLGKSAADEFLALPSRLETPPLAQRSKILDREGRVIATLFSENRVRVGLNQVPELAQQALIAIEDSRFYDHRGVDLKGTARAFAENTSAGSVQQGGSTLTQQYVKNVLVESARSEAGQKAAIEKSVRRKLQEARYALALEKTMTKAQILEGYLNIAYYGNGVYGIGTAANRYWGIPVSKLSLAQGALLAGLVQNPANYDPEAHPKAAIARRNTVLARMSALGNITPEQAAKAAAEPLNLRITDVKSGCEAPGVTAPFFCDYLRRYLEDGPAGAALGSIRQERQEALLGGGLTIRTTLDPKVQRSAQKAVSQQVPRHDRFGAVAVADVVEPGTGAVRGMAVNWGFGTGKRQSKVNFAIGGNLGYQGGSTFKAFVLARALQMGISPQLKLHAPQRYCPKAFTWIGRDGKCGPSNARDSEAGTFTLVKATWLSVNTYFAQLEERTGLVTPPSLAEAMGVRRLDDDSFEGTRLHRFPTFVLGVDGVSPLAMAGAYATFAARGVYCPPNPIESITDSKGEEITLPTSPCSQVLEREVADGVTSILRGVIDGPAGHRTGRSASIGRPAAGKTGTTNDSRAAWFIGYTPQLSTAVWVGKTTPTPMQRVTINGRHYKAVYGGSLPAPIWRQVMRGALAGVPAEDFADPPKLDTGTLVPVPDVTGQPLDVAQDALRDLGFGVTVGRAVNAGPIPAGAVARTSPPAASSVPAGSTITLVPSNGLAPVPVAPSPTGAPEPTPAPEPTGSPAPTATAKPSPTPSPTKKKPR